MAMPAGAVEGQNTSKWEGQRCEPRPARHRGASIQSPEQGRADTVEEIRAALEREVSHTPLTRNALADELGTSVHTLNSWLKLSRTEGGHGMPAWALVQFLTNPRLLRPEGRARLLRAIARGAGCFVAPLPLSQGAVQLERGVAELARELGDVSARVLTASAARSPGGSTYTTAERKAIAAEADELAEKAHILSYACNPSPGVARG